jgi:hypothetical protein
MTIDIEKTIVVKTKGKFFALIILVLAICFLLFFPLNNDLIPGVSNSILAIIVASCYIIYSVYESFRNYNYIYFNDDSDKIVLRYFTHAFFTTKKNAIEIPKKDFAGYKVNSVFMKYRESIVLYRSSGKGVAKYPPVSITALNNAQRFDMLKSLNDLWKKNGGKVIS